MGRTEINKIAINMMRNNVHYEMSIKSLIETWQKELEENQKEVKNCNDFEVKLTATATNMQLYKCIEQLKIMML